MSAPHFFFTRTSLHACLAIKTAPANNGVIFDKTTASINTTAPTRHHSGGKTPKRPVILAMRQAQLKKNPICGGFTPNYGY
jgi:hypothetical protein